jgi:tRNA threonylcarbamoyladenosine biosynthesis protein TsaB
MIILGIETATIQAGVAIGGFEGVIASFECARGPRHVEVLAPGIEFICRQSGIELREVSAIAVDIGPGLFSGLRVGVATAKAMAQALRIPVIGLGSLDLLAFPFRYSDRLVVAAIDARRGELFSAHYRQVPGGIQRVLEPHLASVDEVASEIEASGQECLLVGDGALRYSDVLRAGGKVELATSNPHPSAAALVELAHPIAIREEFVHPSELAPVYLRKSDAEMNLERRMRESSR